MKQTLTAILIGIGISALADMPTITNVTARQRYPWNGKVDITYTATGDLEATAEACGLSQTTINVTAMDRTTGNTYAAYSLSGDTGLSAGTHSLVWDMNADGLTFISDDIVFDVSCEGVPLFCIVDLSGGANAAAYPVTYLTEPPSGGFNKNEYKTTKLVLRRLGCGPIPTLDATIANRFYVGLFEVTQKQYFLVMGSNPSYSLGDTLPVDYVSYNDIRGSSLGSQWPVSNAVDSDSFLGKLRARTGLDFDLPTQAQWEYACRAGTSTTYSYGDSADGNYMWYGDNPGQTHEVGTKLPNPWGFYDMHGNAEEWCLDGGSEYFRATCGGCVGYRADMCTSSSRFSEPPSRSSGGIGFRLVRTVSD